jgi:hypothetical protein
MEIGIADVAMLTDEWKVEKMSLDFLNSMKCDKASTFDSKLEKLESFYFD